MLTRCKFRCESVKPAEGYTEPAENIQLWATYSDSPEDNTYSLYTPTGQLNFTVTNPNIIGKFELGKSYYIDITPVE